MSDKSSRRIVGYDHVLCPAEEMSARMGPRLKRGWEPHGAAIPWAGGEVLQYLIRRECNLPDWFDAWNSSPDDYVPVSLEPDDLIDFVLFGDSEPTVAKVRDVPVEMWEHIARWRYAE